MAKLFIAFLILILSSTSLAQEKNRGFYFEGSLGTALSNIGTKKGSRGSLKPGLISNLNIGKYFGPNLIVETGVDYTPRGLIYTFVGQLYTPTYGRLIQHFDFISIPARIGFQLGKKVKFYAKQSLNFDLLIRNKSKYLTWYEHETVWKSSDIFKKTNVSITSTLGFNIPLGNCYFGSSLNANVGLLNIYKNGYDLYDPNDPIHVGDRSRHITVDLSMHFGYRF